MASLQNEQIDQSYQGLIKTANNLGAAPFPPAKLQYGNGTELPITIGDGTSIGIGDIVTIASGTRNIDLKLKQFSHKWCNRYRCSGRYYKHCEWYI